MKRKKTRRYISGMLVAVLLFLLCVVQNVNAEDVPAGSGLPRLVDDADILTDRRKRTESAVGYSQRGAGV